MVSGSKMKGAFPKARWAHGSVRREEGDGADNGQEDASRRKPGGPFPSALSWLCFHHSSPRLEGPRKNTREDPGRPGLVGLERSQILWAADSAAGTSASPALWVWGMPAPSGARAEHQMMWQHCSTRQSR